MDKETINNYLKEVERLMLEGKFIQANKTLEFVLINIRADLKGVEGASR